MLKKPRIFPIEISKMKGPLRGFDAPSGLGKTISLFYRFARSSETPHNVFLTFLNHPTLAIKWMVFAQHILYGSTLRARDREMLILRIGWLCQSEYEWGQHKLFAKKAKLNDIEIERIKVGPLAKEWSEYESNLLKAVDELNETSNMSDETWGALSKHLNTKQMMDLVFTVGEYTMVSMALNTFGVQMDADLNGF